MERDDFLARVRAARPTGSLPPSPGASGPLVWAPEDGELVERFVTNLTAVDGIAHRTTAADAVATVMSILDEHDTIRVLAWDEAQLPVTGMHGAFAVAGVDVVEANLPPHITDRRAHQLEYDDVVAGVTGAAAGLAESGSIVLDSGPGRSRMASLIPLVHIALLPSADIHASLSHYAAAQPEAAATTANLIFITGPSRTGDIETHLNLGVHGPRHLHVVVID